MRMILRQTIVNNLKEIHLEIMNELVQGVPIEQVGVGHEWFFNKIAQPLGLKYKDNLITRGLTQESAKRLLLYWQNPDREIPTMKDGLPEIDPSFIDDGQVVRSIYWLDLPKSIQKKYRGPHCHGRIIYYRNRLGDEAFRWMDRDPTKGSAWDINEELTDSKAISLLKYPEREY